jgi:hypothetical protein
VILVAALLFAGLFALFRAVIRSFEVTCEVCVTFDGRTVCREAVGADREEATRIAHRRACEFLAIDSAARRECVEREADSGVCEVE